MIEALKSKFSKKPIKVVGCGLAGAEVALILANNGFDVHIFDDGNNRPKTNFGYYSKFETFMTENMQSELNFLGSPLLSIAKKHDFHNFGFEYDENFMFAVRKHLESNPKIKIFSATIDQLNLAETTILATGHNTNPKLLQELENYVEKKRICFFHPEKMILDAASVNLEKLNFVSETECYANLSEEEYDAVCEKILAYDQHYHASENSEKQQITVEGILKRGKAALRNSIMRPHFDERSRCYASLKLTYNPHQKILILDDFCSALDEEEQQQIVWTILALKGCQILQHSAVCQRTYLLAPSCLNNHLQICEHLYVCGGLCGTAGSFESLLLANYCAYRVICDLKGSVGAHLLLENTCIGRILNNLLEKSVIKFRLFNLKYDIMNEKDFERFKKEVAVQTFLSKSQVEKFKEKFYGKYF